MMGLNSQIGGKVRMLRITGLILALLVVQPLWAAQVDGVRGLRLGANSPSLVAVHPMSTLWMGRDAATSVVDARGEHHRDLSKIS